MNIKFENHSVSGIYREYAGFILNIPGHAIGNKAVVAKVPDELVTDVKRYISANNPCVVITDIDGEDTEAAAKEAAEKAEADRLAAEAAEADRLAQEAAELAAKEQAEADAAAEAEKNEAAAKEAAEKAEASKSKKGGK